MRWSLPVLLVFLAVFLGISSLYSLLLDLWLRDRDRFQDRIDEEFRSKQRERARKSPLFKNLAQLAAESAAEDEDRPPLARRLEMLIEQAGLSFSVRALLIAAGVCALVLGVATGLLSRNVLVGLAGAPVGTVCPVLFLAVKRRERLEKLQAQLPDAFDTMARVLRAGQTLPMAFQTVADEMDLPLAAEFAFCQEQQNLGLPPEIALRELARRTGLLEVRIFVLALLVQQRSGGNLSELLDKLGGVVRQRLWARNRIQALTAEGRLQALVLMALPPLIFGTLLFFKRSYVQGLLDHPLLLLVTLVFQIAGAVWVRRITRFDG